MDEIDRHNAIQEFIQSAGPDQWMGYAAELKAASELLWADEPNGRLISMTGTPGPDPGDFAEKIDKPAISRTFILLAGLSMENMLKGLAVATDPSLVNAGVLDERIKTHRLMDLVKLIPGLVLDRHESEMLAVAQEAIPYWGRYPVPRRFNELRVEAVLDLNFKDAFDRLYDKIHLRLYGTIRDGWDSGAGSVLNHFRSSEFEPGMLSDRKPSPRARRPIIGIPSRANSPGVRLDGPPNRARLPYHSESSGTVGLTIVEPVTGR